MKRNVKEIFEWANSIGDSNINNRILAKVMPVLIEAKISLTDSKIQENSDLEVPQNIYDAIKKSAQELLDAQFQEEK